MTYAIRNTAADAVVQIHKTKKAAEAESARLNKMVADGPVDHIVQTDQDGIEQSPDPGSRAGQIMYEGETVKYVVELLPEPED